MKKSCFITKLKKKKIRKLLKNYIFLSGIGLYNLGNAEPILGRTSAALILAVIVPTKVNGR